MAFAFNPVMFLIVRQSLQGKIPDNQLMLYSLWCARAGAISLTRAVAPLALAQREATQVQLNQSQTKVAIFQQVVGEQKADVRDHILKAVDSLSKAA